MDDFCGAALTFSEALRSFSKFEALCAALGLRLAPDKTAFPSTSMEWLGRDFNSCDMTVTIPAQKLQEVRDLSTAWMFKRAASRRDLQVLAGKLLHISHCVTPARRFMSRVLALLRAAPPTGTVKIDSETRRDIQWFIDYADACNGRLLLSPSLPVFWIECDACLEGAGGFSAHHYYSFRFPPGDIENRHISQLEAINIVAAIKTLTPPSLHAHVVRVTTDNSASVHALNTGRTRDHLLAACARELWLIAALQQLQIELVHAPGETLILADALSRRHKHPSFEATVSKITCDRRITAVQPVPSAWHTWTTSAVQPSPSLRP